MLRSVESLRLMSLRWWIAWSCALLLAFPVDAADSGSALLYARGAVLVDGKPVTDTVALFPGSSVQTNENSSANITAAGSTLMVSPKSQLAYAADSINLQHGGVAVATSARLKVRIGCLTVAPVSGNWTRYEVADVSGLVKVAAKKENVAVESGSALAAASKAPASAAADMTLTEGHETAREESCEPPEHSQTARPAAVYPFYTSPYFLYGTIGAAAGFTTWILWRCDDPVSPSSPASSSGNGC